MADWRSSLLRELNCPVTQVNLVALLQWGLSESQPPSLHNPLGAAQYDFDSGEWLLRDAERSFPSNAAAIEYYRRILNRPRFSAIPIALRSRFSLKVIWDAINSSPWRPVGYQNGYYPVRLFRVAVVPGTQGAARQEPVSAQAHDIFRAWHNLTHELRHHTPRQIAHVRHYARRMHSAVR